MIAFADELYDAQLLRAIGHTPYGGAEYGECLATAVTITNGDRESWYRGWTALADRTFAAASASAAAGRRKSAERAYLRASNYYRTAYVFHLQSPLPEVARAAYRRQREAFALASEQMERPLERLAIAFEGATMPGYFCAAESADDAPRPLVIAVGGYDSPAEESYFFNAVAARSRGYHCVFFDGPGQGAQLIEDGVPFRPDWHRALSAVIDVVATRPEVDARRIAIIGESWGGYLVPGAAARDRRIAACVLDPAQLGLFRGILARLPLPQAWKADLPHGPRWLVRLLRVVIARLAKRPTAGWAIRRGVLAHGVASPWDYVVDAARYEQADLVGDIRCPTLVCDAADDDLAAQAREFYGRLACDKRYLRFTRAEGASEHCSMGNRGLYHERVFDWLDEKLANLQS